MKIFQVLKKWTRRCAAYQRRRPKVRPMTNVARTCTNCGQEFEGNYCPRCGQETPTNRISLRGALLTWVDIWGFRNHNLFRTLWELIYRPGYMIGNYLDGHRVIYFQPFKTLVVVAAAYALMMAVFPSTIVNGESIEVAVNEAIDDTKEAKNQVGSKTAAAIKAFDNNFDRFRREHMVLFLLMYHSFMAVAAWRVFRKSPRRPKLYLSEHFVAQVYISSQMLMLAIPFVPFIDAAKATGVYRFSSVWVLPLLFIYDYKQLYGFSWLRTAWKTINTMLLFILVLAAIFVLALLITVIVYYFQ